MGGSNSGRHGGKSTTQGRNILDVRKLQRDRLLTPGRGFDLTWTRRGQPNGAISLRVNTDSVNLIYRHGGDTGQEMDYPVMIDWTPCNYGGRRAWWRCPCCGRRVALLYSGKTFSCRQCQRLEYESTRTAPDSKHFERADKIRARLGWCAGIANPAGGRPKGMHWKTYVRLYQELNKHSFAAMQGTQQWVQRLKGKMGGIGA